MVTNLLILFHLKLAYVLYTSYFLPKQCVMLEFHFMKSAPAGNRTPDSIRVKTVHACSLTLKLCAEVWKTRYECSLSPGNENSKLEMETTKFPAKIDFNFHWKSSSLQTETSDFRPDFLFLFLNSAQSSGWIF